MEIKLVMTSQRVREGESRAEHSLANGPLRAWSKEQSEYSMTRRNALVSGGMLVPC